MWLVQLEPGFWLLSVLLRFLFLLLRLQLRLTHRLLPGLQARHVLRSAKNPACGARAVKCFGSNECESWDRIASTIPWESCSHKINPFQVGVLEEQSQYDKNREIHFADEHGAKTDVPFWGWNLLFPCVHFRTINQSQDTRLTPHVLARELPRATWQCPPNSAPLAGRADLPQCAPSTRSARLVGDRRTCLSEVTHSNQIF